MSPLFFEIVCIILHNWFRYRWSTIAKNLPGRTDNEIKNLWHTNIKRRVMDPNMLSKRPKKNKQKRESSGIKPLDRSNSGFSSGATDSSITTMEASIGDRIGSKLEDEFNVESILETTIGRSNSDFSSRASADLSTTTANAEMITCNYMGGKEEETERFWLDTLSMDFTTVETPASPSHYFNLLDSDNDIDFWRAIFMDTERDLQQVSQSHWIF